MIIAGYGNLDSYFETAMINAEQFNSSDLHDGYVDTYYLSQDTIQEVPTDWQTTTVLKCAFNGTLSAGNIPIESNCTMLRIKRRKQGEYEYQTIFEQIVTPETTENLSFTFYDNTVRANSTYEYLCILVVKENNSIIEKSGIKSEIDTHQKGFLIVEPDIIFKAYGNIELSSARNKPCSVVAPYNRKYPVIVNNGNLNYDSGTMNGIFGVFNEQICSFDFHGSVEYQRKLLDFLYDGHPKLLKDEKGQMWLIGVSSNQITLDTINYTDAVSLSFEWTECGNCDDISTLYDNGWFEWLEV